MQVPQQEIVERCRNLFPDLIADIKQGFSDFDEHTTPAVRLTVERARPKWVNERVLSLWKKRYGESLQTGVRVQVADNMQVLFVEGKQYSIGIRFKKLDGSYLCQNYPTSAQSNLRENGCFPEFETDVAHIVLGYRYGFAMQ